MRITTAIVSLLMATLSQAVSQAQNNQGSGSDITMAEVQNSVLAEGNWTKIALGGKHDGIYEITYSQLESWGYRHPENIGIFGYGAHQLPQKIAEYSTLPNDLPEIAIFHDTANRRILFFGQGLVSWQYSAAEGFSHTPNTYSKQACYFVCEKNTPSKTMEYLANAAINNDSTVSTFDAHLLHEEELVSLGNSGRELYGESFIYLSSQLFSFAEVLQPGTLRIKADFAALSSAESEFTLRLGNEEIGKATARGTTDEHTYGIAASLDKTITLQAAQSPEIRINYSSQQSAAKAHLNYILLEGKRNIALEDGSSYTLFRNVASASQTLEYVFAEKAGASLQVWDVTDAQNAKIQESKNNRFIPLGKGLREYALADVGGKRFPGVSLVGKVDNQNLHAMNSADMVIITAPALKTYAQQLADFRREHDNMKVAVVTTTQVFNEYSSGTPDASAIRRFMCQAFGKSSGLLLILGDGHYDNRKVADNAFYVVSYQTENSLAGASSTVFDDYFGYLHNDHDLELGIGRIPVHTTHDAEAVVNKIIDYSRNRHYGKWKNNLCFVSDDDKVGSGSSDTPNSHMRHNEEIIKVLEQEQRHKEFNYQKIYLPAYTQTKTSSGTDYPDARKAFNEMLKQGALMVNLAGHGATGSFAHEMLMTTALASQLNMKNLPLWITASCEISRWDNDETSMGETLLQNPNGGAIALISATRVVYSQQNLALNLAIARNLLKRNADGTRYTLGDIMREAKRELGNDFNKLSFCLLGDPSMQLSYPEYKLEAEVVPALESDIESNASAENNRHTVRGKVINAETGETATWFNGLIYPTVFDQPDSVSADKGVHQEPVLVFANRDRKIFAGRDIISNGEFEFSFIVPKDVSAHTTDALINLYACNEDNIEANGFVDNLEIVRPDASASADSIGPEIKTVFINSADFKNGDTVGSTPYFFAELHDASGFNSTGNGIGHDITLTIRCTSNTMLAPRQYILNNSFTTYTGDPYTGNVRYTVPELDDGEYDITFRVWDAMNNSSTAQLHIVVRASQKPQALQVQAYPSPVAQGETITFRVLHQMPESPTRLRLQIFSQTGAKVYETESNVSASEVVYLTSALNADETSTFFGASAIKWKASVAPGLYIYKVYLSGKTSESTSESKIFMVDAK